jgi:hypothetical protein
MRLQAENVVQWGLPSSCTDGWAMSYDFGMPIVAGVRMPREQALQLAALLTRSGFDRASRVLLDAVTNGHEFVSLTTDDREAMLAVLHHPSTEILVELRTVLFAELNWRRGLVGSARRPQTPYAQHG